MQETKLSESARFVVDAFPHYYEDEKYVVLDVPQLTSLQSTGLASVALVYNNNENSFLQSHNNQTTLLKYNNHIFNSIPLNELHNQNENQGGAPNNQTQNAYVCSPERSEGITTWSKGRL